MEILRLGSLPGETEYQITCYYCDSLLKFKENEIEKYSYGWGQEDKGIKCPVCHTKLSLETAIKV